MNVSPGIRKLAPWLAAVLLVVGGVVLAWLSPSCADEGCPTLTQLAEYRPPEPARVYDRDGELVTQLAGPRRVVVGLSEIPALIRDGYVAVEDRRFWEHGGIDFRGTGRALVRNIRSAGVEEGASTITMQLVRNVYEADMADWNRWRRKLAELRLALEIESLVPKERLLELYLNHIYLGGGVYGVETAARSYFGKPVAAVSTGEAALLVGLAKNPEGYNPRRHPERARARRDLVLGLFAEAGLVTHAEAAAARAEPIRLGPDRRAERRGLYYFAAVEARVRDLFPDPAERQGLRVYTGYDGALQAAAEEALAWRIGSVEAGRFGAYRHPTPPEGPLPRVRDGTSPLLQGMVVALDPRKGTVRALVGGRDFEHSEFDRALLARRQPGSAFKPFAYAAALGTGVPLTRVVETTPLAIRQAGGDVWSPRDGQSEGEPMTLRTALARSSNTAAVRVGQLAGIERVRTLAGELGISTDIPAVPSVFLGAADVVPVELVGAYAAFANGGRRVRPHLVTRIEARDGTVLWRPDATPAPALDPAVAYLTLDALRWAVDGGTGWRVREAGYRGPAAGKTGTTDDGHDAWFVGATPDLVAGVWLGFDDPRNIVPGASGGTLAAPVWGRMMARAPHRGTDAVAWTPPAGLRRARVDITTGQLARGHCPGDVVRDELFLPGTEPVQLCTLHQGNFLDRFFGRIKGVFR